MNKKGIFAKVVNLSIILLVVVSICIVGCAQPTAPATSPTPTTTPTPDQPKTLKIGFLTHCTGFFALFDLQDSVYTKALAEVINERGGVTINGEKYNIELVEEEGKSTIDGTTAAANKLVFDHKVQFVVGPTAFWNLGSTPTFEQNKVLHIATWNTMQPQELNVDTPYCFLGTNSSLGNALGMLKVMRKLFPDVKKVAIIIPDDGSAPYLAPPIKQALADEGVTLLGEPPDYAVLFPNETVDFNPIAAKCNAIKDADGYMQINGDVNSIAKIVTGLRDLNNFKPYCAGTVDAHDFLVIADKSVATNVAFTCPTAHAPGNNPLMDEIFDRGGQVTPCNMSHPRSLWLLVQALEGANSLDPTTVKNYLESVDHVDTLFGPGTMCGEKTYGIKHAIQHPIAYQSLQDGEIGTPGWIQDVPIIP